MFELTNVSEEQNSFELAYMTRKFVVNHSGSN